jgi:hypothetical protein
MDSSKEVGLAANADKTKCGMLLSCHHNAGQNAINIADRYFENVAQFEYLGKTVKN